MNLIEHVHDARVHGRRVRVLAATAARLLPARPLRVLDVGCGDGQLAALLMQLRPDIELVGVEFAPRPNCAIPVTAFDGRTLPFADGSFDVVMFVDVLHHTEEPRVLLREAARVARTAVLLKDHLRDGFAAQATLKFMDDVGNRRHGVVLPYNYLSHAEWIGLWSECGLVPKETDAVAGLYPFPANLIFGRGLHLFTRLEKMQRLAGL